LGLESLDQNSLGMMLSLWHLVQGLKIELISRFDSNK